MKKAGVVGVVVLAHCVVIGSVVLIQGCGTTPKPVEPQAPQVVMPPVVEPPAEKIEPVEVPPVKVTPPVAPATKSYTVKSGDSLSMIAKRFNVSQRDIMKLNKISNANKIHVGQKLTLPGYVNLDAPVPPRPKKAVSAVKKSTKAAAPVAAASGEYVVKSGDSLGKIAHSHGTTVAALKQANNLTSDSLQIGQKLVLSGKAPAVEAPALPAEGAPGVEALVAPAEGAPAEGTPAPKSNEVLHVVEPNQDLNSIAMMYGVRVEDMMKLNNLATPDVKVGQTLKIPPPVE